MAKFVNFRLFFVHDFFLVILFRKLFSTAKIKAAYFFIFEPSEDQKCHFMKHPTVHHYIRDRVNV